MAGCSSSAVVGIDGDGKDDSLPGGECEGACPSAQYASSLAGDWSEPMDLDATPDGGAVYFGRFAGELQLPGLVLDYSQYSGNDEYLIKYAADGSVEWVRRFKGNTVSGDVAVRPSGELVLFGTFQDTIDFGTGPLHANGFVDSFFMTILPDGTVLPPRVYDAEVHSIRTALSTNGDLLVAAQVDSTQTIDGVTLTAIGTQSDAVLRISPQGDILAGHALGPEAWLAGVAARPDGGGLFLGSTRQPISVGGVSIPSPDQGEGPFLLAVDAAGQPAWGEPIGPTAEDGGDLATAFPAGLGVRSDGRAVVVLGSTPVGWGVASPPGQLSLHTFESDGTELSQVTIGTSNSMYSDVALASNGDVLLAGSFTGELTLGDVALDSPNFQDGFLARYSPAGELLWVETVGVPDSIQQILNVAVATGDRPIMGGQYYGTGFSIGDDPMPEANTNPAAFFSGFAP